jgi:hypothetical protein
MKLFALIMTLASLTSLLPQQSQAQALPPAQMYLKSVHDFISFKFRIRELTKSPFVIKGNNCEVHISGTPRIRSSSFGDIKVVVFNGQDSITFRHTDHRGDIQRPEINFSRGQLIVGGSIVTTNYDGSSVDVKHQELRIFDNTVEIEDYDGASTISCSF